MFLGDDDDDGSMKVESGSTSSKIDLAAGGDVIRQYAFNCRFVRLCSKVVDRYTAAAGRAAVDERQYTDATDVALAVLPHFPSRPFIFLPFLALTSFLLLVDGGAAGCETAP